jgi:hypothetical protein
MENTVALAAIGLAASSIAGLIWLAKFVAKTLGKDLQEHTKASIAAANASKELKITVARVGKQAELSAKNSHEQFTFMKKLNGKLESAIIQKVTNQTVDHQVVTQQDIVNQ